MVDPVSGAKTGPFLLTKAGYGGATVSPDGATIAYMGTQDGTTFSLYKQDTIGGSPQVGFANCDNPSWSPDGTRIACWQRDANPATTYTLVVVNADGGGGHPIYGPLPFSGGGAGEGLSWSPDGSRIITTDGHKIISLPAAGGSGPTTLVAATAGDSIYAASMSPDSGSLAFVRQTDLGGGNYASSLVIRSLATGTEQPIVQESPPDHVIGFVGAPPWSSDGKRVVFVESTFGTAVSTSGRVVIVDSATGGNRKVLMETGEGEQINSVAWGTSTQPSYFVKQIELTQSVTPDLSLPPVDPLAAAPLQLPWSEPSIAGYPLPLIAGHSTLMRIYVGDASLAPGQTASRQVGYRITGPPTAIEGTAPVTVTSPLDAPSQGDLTAAINVWLPPDAAVAGAGGRTFSVEINPDQSETECAGCFPNGNDADVTGVQFDNNGDITIRPTAVTLLELNGRRQPSPSFNAGFWKDLARWLPVADAGIKLLPNGPPIEVDVRPRNPAVSDYCDFVGPAVDLVFAAAGGGPFSSTGPAIPVAYASPVLSGATCGGAENSRTGRVLILSPDIGDLAHEVGHHVGLGHVVAAGPNGLPAAGEVTLPYAGIGGWGFERSPSNTTILHDKGQAGDLMSYSVDRWMSPFSWNGAYKGVLAEAPAVVPHPPRAHIASTASRRLVAGVLTPAGGQIIASLVADTSAPVATGPVAGRLIALNAHGTAIGAVAVRGAAGDETPGATHDSVPFVVALPGRLRVAALVLRDAKGKAVATLRASRRRPSARFVGLPRRARSSKALKVRWVTADRDSRTLTTLVSARRGSGKWQLVAAAAGGSRSATATPAKLGRGRTLRLRIVVSDGLNTTTRLSRVIRMR